MIFAIFLFVCLFVLTIVCVQLGNSYLETRRAKRVAAMLRVIPEMTTATPNLLRDMVKPGDANSLPGKFKSLNLVRGASEMLQQASLSWSAVRLFRTMGFLGIAGISAGIMFPVVLNGFVSSLVFGMAGAALPLLYVRNVLSKRMAALERQLPDAMDFLARSMRAGHAFTISLGMAGDDLADPLGQEFRTLYNEQNLGASLNTAFGNLIKRVPLLDMRFFASAVQLQRRTGGNLSEILGRLSEVIRERFRLRGHVRAVSAHGKMTAGILTALPVLTALGLMLVAPGYLQGMLSDSDGQKLLLGAVISQIIGNLIIRKIVRIRV